ncbi:MULTISPECIES: glycoside hydrolase family 18 [Prevotella]|uniref:glycoside hydrolase family 18 n=1 Tax=Prevotella TaxID=838 RepID=UPI001303EBD8|nr:MULTISPECIES: glycoside hydrolase family 18 [Prevotella]MCF2637256.1 glycosyl hydrolase [Prevotella dentalis]MEE0619478.1 glycoside hydrolase family 18 [Prevotella sp.]
MKYIMPLLLIACMFASCDTDVENATVVAPTTYGPQYYKNLRDYKKSDHSIAWGWFADYTQSTSLATRFLGLPDSLDICSLWGGIPSDDSTHVDTHYLPEVYREMKYVQEVKGTRLVVPTIIRIRTRPEFYDSIWVKQNDPQAAMRAYAQDLLRPIFENGLDGIDMDYEPEGDPLSGGNLDYFVEYVGQFVGPMASPDSTFTYPDGFTIKGNPNMLLCIDYYGSAPSGNTNKFTNWYVNQTYGGSPGRVPFSGCPTEKVVYTENVGDNWKAAECGQLLNYARYQPSTGRKGGFGAFFMHRDYINTGYGCSNYANMRHGIQIQNPAIH